MSFLPIMIAMVVAVSTMGIAGYYRGHASASKACDVERRELVSAADAERLRLEQINRERADAAADLNHQIETESRQHDN